MSKLCLSWELGQGNLRSTVLEVSMEPIYEGHSPGNVAHRHEIRVVKHLRPHLLTPLDSSRCLDAKDDTLHLLYPWTTCTYVYILLQFLNVFFSLRVKNKPHDEDATLCIYFRTGRSHKDVQSFHVCAYSAQMAQNKSLSRKLAGASKRYTFSTNRKWLNTIKLKNNYRV